MSYRLAWESGRDLHEFSFAQKILHGSLPVACKMTKDTLYCWDSRSTEHTCYKMKQVFHSWSILSILWSSLESLLVDSGFYPLPFLCQKNVWILWVLLSCHLCSSRNHSGMKYFCKLIFHMHTSAKSCFSVFWQSSKSCLLMAQSYVCINTLHISYCLAICPINTIIKNALYNKLKGMQSKRKKCHNIEPNINL